jgi:hypothetical protein
MPGSGTSRRMGFQTEDTAAGNNSRSSDFHLLVHASELALDSGTGNARQRHFTFTRTSYNSQLLAAFRIVFGAPF